MAQRILIRGNFLLPIERESFLGWAFDFALLLRPFMPVYILHLRPKERGL